MEKVNKTPQRNKESKDLNMMRLNKLRLIKPTLYSFIKIKF